MPTGKKRLMSFPNRDKTTMGHSSKAVTHELQKYVQINTLEPKSLMTILN